ncbi:MAG: helix-turn-helix domain-containing protein, partial [Thermodesulfobacteriota bacterium]
MDSVEREINHKLRIVNYAQALRNISKACPYFGISRQVYYKWKRSYDEHGEKGLGSRKPGPKRSKFRTPENIEEKVIYLRRKYYFGQLAISSYLSRYYG